MFKHIDICLSGPICDCEEQHLAWDILRNVNEVTILKIWCRTCHEAVTASRKDFRATFCLDTPYPGKSAKTKKKRDRGGLKVLDGGKGAPTSDEQEEK